MLRIENRRITEAHSKKIRGLTKGFFFLLSTLYFKTFILLIFMISIDTIYAVPFYVQDVSFFSNTLHASNISLDEKLMAAANETKMERRKDISDLKILVERRTQHEPEFFSKVSTLYIVILNLYVTIFQNIKIYLYFIFSTMIVSKKSKILQIGLLIRAEKWK